MIAKHEEAMHTLKETHDGELKVANLIMLQPTSMNLEHFDDQELPYEYALRAARECSVAPGTNRIFLF